MKENINWKNWYIALMLTLGVLIVFFYWLTHHFA
jgi:hypothetical protein